MMQNDGWEKKQVKRASYRAVLRSDAGEEQLDRAFAECQVILEQEKEAHRLLTFTDMGAFFFYIPRASRRPQYPINCSLLQFLFCRNGLR